MHFSQNVASHFTALSSELKKAKEEVAQLKKKTAQLEEKSVCKCCPFGCFYFLLTLFSFFFFFFVCSTAAFVFRLVGLVNFGGCRETNLSSQLQWCGASAGG
jgi:hypothetical protein